MKSPTDKELKAIVYKTGAHSHAYLYGCETVQELAMRLLLARRALRLAIKLGTNTPGCIVRKMKRALL